MTWRAGVDVLTFGLTKTGAIGCEIILLFGGARKKFSELRARAKRSGHMPPKMRFLAAQAHAMLEDGLWLTLAGQANARAAALTDVFTGAGYALAYPVDGNEVFPILPEDVAQRLMAAGAKFYPWPGGSLPVCLFVEYGGGGHRGARRGAEGLGAFGEGPAQPVAEMLDG
jgi:threonine aldolase